MQKYLGMKKSLKKRLIACNDKLRQTTNRKAKEDAVNTLETKKIRTGKNN